MSIYKNLMEDGDVLNLDVQLMSTQSILEKNLEVVDIKGNKKSIPLHVHPGKGGQHGPRYKLYPNTDKELDFVTVRPKGKINLERSNGNKIGIRDHLPLVKALVVKTYDGALELFNSKDPTLLEKEIKEYNELPVEERKKLVREYNKRFL